MFNINENTQIKGLEKTGCKISHIQACLHDKKQHEPVKYKYQGKRVSKGNVLVHTDKGDFNLYFEEENGWLRLLEVL